MTALSATRSNGGVWLFPSTYVVHLAEEYFGADGFTVWLQRTFGIPLTDAEFVAWNVFGLMLMCVGAVLVGRGAQFRFIEIALAVAVLGNAAGHAISSIVTLTYSPGLITGVLLWGPLGWFRLRMGAAATSRRGRIAGVSIGVLVIFVTLTILALRITWV